MNLLNNEFVNMLGEWVRAYPGKSNYEVEKKNQIKIMLCNTIIKTFINKITFELYEDEIRDIMEKSFPRQYKSNKNDKTRKMYIELCEFCFGDVSKRNIKKKRVCVDNCFQPTFYQSVSDISKYIIISLENNFYNRGFLYSINEFFMNDIESTHFDKSMIQLKVKQDFFSRFDTNNYFYEPLLKDIEESNEYKQLHHMSQFANFNHFLALFHNYCDIFYALQNNDIIIEIDKLNKNIINLFEDCRKMSDGIISMTMKKIINEKEKDERIPENYFKPKFFIGYYNEENKIGNDLDVLIETINYIAIKTNHGKKSCKLIEYDNEKINEIIKSHDKVITNCNEYFRLTGKCIINGDAYFKLGDKLLINGNVYFRLNDKVIINGNEYCRLNDNLIFNDNLTLNDELQYDFQFQDDEFQDLFKDFLE
jgi:hypothetical protein